MANLIQLRRDISSNWISVNPILGQGELGIETDTLKIKCGDGTSTWSALSYLIDTGNYLTTSDIGSAVQAYDSDLTTWAGKTAPTGTVVGTTDTQTLTNKTITGLKETKSVISASDIDLSAGNYFTKTISADTTFTVSNVASSDSVSAFVLDLTNGGAFTVTWFSGIDWPSATAPTLTASGVDTLAFFTYDGGTNWKGFVLGQGMA